MIANALQGLKCEAALQSERIQIVCPDWLHACAKQKAWVPEDSYSLRQKVNPACTLSLEDAIDQELASEVPENFYLFSDCTFLLLGFTTDETVKIGKLIRRGQGITFWKLQEGITHIVVKDDQLEQDMIRYVLECGFSTS